MLEHLHGHDAIEAPLGREPIHVGRDHFDVAQPAARGLDEDPGALRVRIGDRADAGPGVALRHPERERTPAAAKLENRLAVGKAGVLAGRLQRAGFGLPEVGSSLRPPRAAVLAVRTERDGEELGRDLVMLLVREVRRGRDLGGIHRTRERLLSLRAGLTVAGGDLPHPPLAKAPDPVPDHGIGDQALLDPVDGEPMHLTHRVTPLLSVAAIRRTPSSR